MNDAPTIASPLLSELPGMRHAFFTRAGGVSEGLFASLNTGRGSGDDPAHVAENRARAAAALGRTAAELSTCYQIHSARPVVVDAPLGEARPEGDAVVTRAPGVLCGALAGDCAPVLIADPQARVVAAVHAGWRGALAGVVEAAVVTMVSLGAAPERMSAAVGPCIGPASYEVGLEFLDAFLTVDAANAAFFRPGAGAEKRLFDLPSFVLGRLAAAGVARAEWTGHDTLTDEARFFSNRRAVHRGERDYGRLLSAITLEA